MPSVGSHLRELRERHGVSVEEIARSTRVLHQYLESLEGDDYGSPPGPLFSKGFLPAPRPAGRVAWRGRPLCGPPPPWQPGGGAPPGPRAAAPPVEPRRGGVPAPASPPP